MIVYVSLRRRFFGASSHPGPRGRHGGRRGGRLDGSGRTGTANISGGPGRPETVAVAVEVAAPGCLGGASSEPSSSYLRLGAVTVGLRAMERRISLRASWPQHTGPRLYEA